MAEAPSESLMQQQQPLRQRLEIPNIKIQPASGDEEEDDDDSFSSDDDQKGRPLEKGEAEGESDDSDGDDTSTWDSDDPATPTPRTNREYYPLKGSAEKIYPSPGGDVSSNSRPGVKSGHSVDLYLKTLSDHLGDGDSNQDGDNDLSGIPLSAYRRVVDGGEEVDREQVKQDGESQESNEEDEELKNLQEDPEEDEEEEDIEELDLTNQQGNFFPGDNISPVMIVPSLDALGANSIGALMSHLIDTQPSLFHSQDGSSAEDEDAGTADVMYGKSFDGPQVGHDGQNMQKWEELFRLLEIQHQQQLLLQSEQHERRMEHLKQLMSQQQIELPELQHLDPTGTGEMNTEPTNKQTELHDENPEHARYIPGEGEKEMTSARTGNEYSSGQHHMDARNENTEHAQYIPGDEDEEVTSPRNEYSSGQQHMDARSDSSEESETGNQGNVPVQRDNPAAANANIDSSMMDKSAGMTTWSNIKGQRLDAGSQRSANQQDVNIMRIEDEKQQEDEAVSGSYVKQLQNHYEKEKDSMQKQYEEQLQAVQKEWYQLQQQQQEQQQILHHLLARQQERIEHQQRALNRQREFGQDGDQDRTPTGTPERLQEETDSEGSSNAYSNFTYWKMKEEDTYKALPLTPDKEEKTFLEEDKIAPSLRLKEKHARHVADLKAYYESEIQELRAQLTEVSNLQDYSPSKTMERTNDRLQQNCSKLEAALTYANSRIQDLETTVAGLGARLQDEPEKIATAASTIHTLQKATGDLKQLCHQKDKQLQELAKRNHKLQLSLEQAFQLHDVHAKEDHRDQRMLNRVMAEYKTLAQDHELAKAQLGATEIQLYDAKAEVAELKRKASHLEVEVKRLGHERDKIQQRGHTSVAESLLSAPDQHSSYTAPPPPEERKFLKSTAGYNVFTGEELMDDTSSESLPQASDTESSQDKAPKPSGLHRPPQDEAPKPSGHHRPPPLTLEPGPFDSDLDERPLSPMMKAAAQFQRWQGEDEFTGVIDDSPRTMSTGNESTDSDSDEDGDFTLQNVSTQTNGSVDRGPESASHLGGGTGSRRQWQQPRQSPNILSNVTGESPAGDSSIHIWPESEPRKNTRRSPISKPPERKPATSPRQLARESLARYTKSQSSSQLHLHTSNGHGSQRSQTSPRRNLASQFQAAAGMTAERGSPMGSSDKMDLPSRSGLRQLSNTSSNRYSSRRGLLEGQEGSSSTGSRNRIPAERDGSVETTLARVRAGDILTRPDWQNGSGLQRPSVLSPSRTPKNPEEIGSRIIQKVEEHERRLDELMLVKRKLESALSHLPTSGRGSRQQQEKIEDELEKVGRELGSVRMLLRKYNALKTSSS